MVQPPLLLWPVPDVLILSPLLHISRLLLLEWTNVLRLLLTRLLKLLWLLYLSLLRLHCQLILLLLWCMPRLLLLRSIPLTHYRCAIPHLVACTTTLEARTRHPIA